MVGGNEMKTISQFLFELKTYYNSDDIIEFAIIQQNSINDIRRIRNISVEEFLFFVSVSGVVATDQVLRDRVTKINKDRLPKPNDIGLISRPTIGTPSTPTHSPIVCRRPPVGYVRRKPTSPIITSQYIKKLKESYRKSARLCDGTL